MKHCPKCNTEKAVFEFGKNKRRYDGLQGNCSDCNKKNNKDWYQNNKDHQIKKAKQVRKEKLQWLAEFKKTLKCSKCPESFFRCLDFHHRDKSQKIIDISVAARNWSVERLMTEISKCDILCANCHRKETFEDDLWCL